MRSCSQLRLTILAASLEYEDSNSLPLRWTVGVGTKTLSFPRRPEVTRDRLLRYAR